jgi:hypothetical protein
MKFNGAIIFLFFTIFKNVHAQDYPRDEIDLSRIANDLVAFQDADLNYEDLYENLAQLYTNPANLNSLTIEELRQLNILTEKQVQNLIRYRAEHGDFISVYELQAVPELDLITIYKLVPFVTVIDHQSLINKNLLYRVFHEDNNYFVLRYEKVLQEKESNTTTDEDKQFKGSSDRNYFRFRTSKPGDFSFGITAEKDAGEKISWNPSSHYYGTDYLSFHAQILNKGRLKNLIIGDFQNQFAQGLMLGGAFGMGKGGEAVTPIRKSNVGFLPYTSVNEAGALHGMATTFALSKNIFVSGFFSRSRRDANTNASNDTLSSFIITGLHRNNTELSTRKNIVEENAGAIVQYKFGSLDAGVIFHNTTFSKSINKKISAYNQFVFLGTNNLNTGAYLNYTFQNVSFFSEVSKSLNGGYGVIAGALTSVHKNLDVALLFRRYDKNFYSFYANALSENSQPQNESGFYWGLKYTWSKKYSMSGYLDVFKFPWLKFRSYAPSYGYEWLMRFNYQPSRKILLYVQTREESKVRNRAQGGNVYETAEAIKFNYLVNADYSINPNLRLKTRLQFSDLTISSHTTKGFLLTQDISFTIWKLKITTRHALFDTQDYDNRQYAYENDVWLAYSMPAYDGIGIRDYAMVELKATKKITVWLRYSQTRYTDRNEIGTGADAIHSNIKSDIKIQLRVKL